MAFFGAFHGRTMGSLALTGSKSVQKKGFFPVMQGAHHVPYAYCYRCAYGKTPDSCAVECVKAIEDRCSGTLFPPKRSPRFSSSRCRAKAATSCLRGSFSTNCDALADKHGILIVADEVQCGMGRTGQDVRVQSISDWSPDIMALAKGIASGMPLGATVARAEVMNWKPGAHASTFGGNPVCVAAALATIELLEQELVDKRGASRRSHEGAPERAAASDSRSSATCAAWA